MELWKVGPNWSRVTKVDDWDVFFKGIERLFMKNISGKSLEHAGGTLTADAPPFDITSALELRALKSDDWLHTQAKKGTVRLFGFEYAPDSLNWPKHYYAEDKLKPKNPVVRKEHILQGPERGYMLGKIRVAITTYNRPFVLLLLLQDLVREKKYYNIEVKIYNDCSMDPGYEEVERFIEQNSNWVEMYRFSEHLGTADHWKMINKSLQDQQYADNEYFVSLPDDVRLCHDFFGILIEKWNGLQDPKKGLLVFHVDSTRKYTSCWNAQKPERVIFDGVAYDRTGWADGFFITDRSRLEKIGFSIPAVGSRWRVRGSNRGSGMGKSLTYKFKNLGFEIYRTLRSLVRLIKVKSAMEHKSPPRTLDFADDSFFLQEARRDKVYGFIATYPPREEVLKDTVRTVAPQVDELFIYLNEYDKVPEWLDQPGVTCVLGKDAEGNLKSNGKFYWADKLEGFFTFYDDDLLYPVDYVEMLLSTLRKYKLKAAVGVHGGVMRFPVKSYYRNRTVYHCRKGLEELKRVHFLGTGTLAYHSSVLSVSLDDFKTTDMDDVFFGLKAKHSGVPLICVPRPDKWLVYNEAKMRGLSTIFDEEIDDDSRQSTLVNGAAPWVVIDVDKPYTLSRMHSELVERRLFGSGAQTTKDFVERLDAPVEPEPKDTPEEDVIVINVSGRVISLSSGVRVPCGGTVNLSKILTAQQIRDSEDLKSYTSGPNALLKVLSGWFQGEEDA